MADIFISYAREDQAWAEALAQALTDHGWSVWWDRNLNAGTDFERVTEKELDAARCVIVLWSAVSTESQWVRAEASEGWERKILIPVCIEEVRQPLKFRSIHSTSLVGWNRSSDEAAFGQLVEDVENLIGPSNGREVVQQPTSSARVHRNTHKPAPGSTHQFPSTCTDVWGIEYVLIQPGTFTMGSESGRDNERPIHEVSITSPFYMGKCPVTQEQYRQVMGSNPSQFQATDRHPVEKVSWENAQQFIEKVNEKEPGCRLPTEAEWEFACRAGTATAFGFGDEEKKLGEYAWYGEGWAEGSTHAVGKKKPNAWGLYDMHGNVWEWVEDWYGRYTGGAVTNPSGPFSGTDRVIRGGGWIASAEFLRSAYRHHLPPGDRNAIVGFRVVRAVM